jgi:squalene synthase HpnC
MTGNAGGAEGRATGQSPGQTKGRGDENFPVASRLIAARLRPHVWAFYDFARAADDIADDSGLDCEEKLRRLDELAEALASGSEGGAADGGKNGPGDFPVARALATSLSETGISRSHADDLLTAFRDDAVKDRYADWDELMAYCRYSAAPCGRYLLAVHGETGEESRAASDALSAALQVINHIQDCGADYRALDRVYLPLDWMTTEGAELTGLNADQLSPALRRVLDRMLDQVDELLDRADGLPHLIRDRRLALESAVVLALARCLTDRLRVRDPLHERVVLRRLDFATLALKGLILGIFVRLKG